MIYSPASIKEIIDILVQRTANPLALRGTRARDSAGDEIIVGGVQSLVLYEPDEMIVQCEAGMLLSELAAILRDQGQWIPTLDPEICEASTVGGALSEDLWQPRAQHSIALRTTVLGGTFVTADGRLFRSGSRVVKSVAGYDTHRSYVGAHGRFGVIAQVTLRVLPMPEYMVWLATPSRLTTGASPLVTAEFECNAMRYVELSGYTEDVEAELARLERDGLPFARLSTQEWSAAIQAYRSAMPEASIAAPARDLLDRLTKVFDPLGVLTS